MGPFGWYYEYNTGYFREGYLIKNKKFRIIINVLLFLFLILSIRSWDSSLTVHIIGGITFAFLMVIHIFLNRKWFVSVSKAFKAGKLNKKAKQQYILDLLLVTAWSTAILSGFSTIGFAIAEDERLFAFSRIHGVSIRLGCILIVIHIYQHRKQIGSYIKMKNV